VFGLRGAHLPALARAVIAAGWFGINSWFGGQALDAILGRLAPAWLGIGIHLWVAFGVFWILNVGIAMRGPQAIGRLAALAAPTLGIAAVALFVWGASAVHGVATCSPRRERSWAARSGWRFSRRSSRRLLLGHARIEHPDYSRYAESQRGQLRGQLVMPIVMAAFAFVGIAVTSATVVVDGKALWNRSICC